MKDSPTATPANIVTAIGGKVPGKSDEMQVMSELRFAFESRVTDICDDLRERARALPTEGICGLLRDYLAR